MISCDNAVSHCPQDQECVMLCDDTNSCKNATFSIIAIIKCDNIDSHKVNMIDELCGNALDFWIAYYILQIVVVLFLVIRSWCICTKNKLDNEDLLSVVEPNMNQSYGTNGSMDEAESYLELHGNDSRTESIFIVQKNNNNNTQIVESDSNDNVNENENKYVSMNVKCDDKITE